MTTWQAMNTLERAGYIFAPTAEGVRASLQGQPPAEASALLDIVRRDREAARAYVLARQEGATVVDDGCTYSLFDALAIGQAVRKGEARLLGKVIFHQQEMTVTARWEPLTGEASAELLNRRRECLKNALEARLKAMENSRWENLTAVEYDQFCAQYGRYYRLLEEYANENVLPVWRSPLPGK
ncbi:MAG: hypothetical protein MRZ54_06390 [Clostridiales bacterium]|nr:hypothetical protein [Clostridiales bacterium]